MWGLVAAGIAAGAVGTGAYGIAGNSSRLFGPSVYRGPGRRKSIALTFDDGPSAGSLLLLEHLSRYNIKSTFFQCGMNVVRFPQIARTIAENGHQLGNHTFSHPLFMFKSPRFIAGELTRAQEVIFSETGVQPRLFRAPYGLRWPGLAAAQSRLGLMGVMWTVIGHDWQWPAERVAKFILGRVTPGGIVCLHDGRGVQPGFDASVLLACIRIIAPVLIERGYRFETVDELLQEDMD